VPHPDQCAKKGIRSILHRLAPFLSEQIPRFLIERKARKTPFHEFLHQPLQSLKLLPPFRHTPFLVLDDPRQPEHSNHGRMRIHLGSRFFCLSYFPPNGETFSGKQSGNSGRTRTPTGVGRMTCCVLTMKHSVRQPIHRPCSRTIRANDRRIHRNKHSLVIPTRFPKQLHQLPIPLWISKPQYLPSFSCRFQKTNSVMHFLAPREIHPDQQNFQRFFCSIRSNRTGTSTECRTSLDALPNSTSSIHRCPCVVIATRSQPVSSTARTNSGPGFPYPSRQVVGIPSFFIFSAH